MLRRLQLPRGRGVVAAQLIKMAKFKPVTFTTELPEGQPVEVYGVGVLPYNSQRQVPVLFLYNQRYPT